MSKPRIYGLLSLLVILVMVFWTWLSSPMMVTITGVGTVDVPATSAVVNLTLSANAVDAQSAISAVEAKAKTMGEFLKSNGIEEGNISQSQVTAVPAALVTPGATGFQSSISMSVTTVRIASLSSLVADLYSQGALVVTQPVLSVDNQAVLQEQALKDALKSADTQATKLGVSKWKFLKKIVSITQASSDPTSTSTSKTNEPAGTNNQLAATNGVFKVSTGVSVVYKMW